MSKRLLWWLIMVGWILGVQLSLLAQPAGQPAAPAAAPAPVAAPAQPMSPVAPAAGTTGEPQVTPPGPTQKPELVKPLDTPEVQGTQKRGRYVEVLEKGEEARRDSLNNRLPRFGESFFARSREELTHSEDGLVPSDYVLRPGDQLHVITYNLKGGESLTDLTVDQNGQSYLPNVGPSTLGGLTLGQAQIQLNNQVQSRAPNFRVKVTMTKIRKIRVFVLGEARKPGGLLVNPGSTLLDALLASEGPTDTGSYRSIQLQRGGRTTAIYDIYQLLLNGATNSPRLYEGDRIFVPSTGPQVALAGEVLRPAIYEVLTEKNLGQIITLAGGLKPQADRRQILLERMSGNSARKLRDIEFSEVQHINLKNGDTVTVKPLLNDLANAVYIQGAVKRPGWFSLPKGMRVSQLLAKAQGMKDGVYPGRAEIYRRSAPELPIEVISFDLGAALQKGAPDSVNLALQAKDTLIVYEVSDSFVNSAQVRVQGEVANPGEYARFTNMKLRDLVFQAGGANPEASEVVEIASRGPNGQLSRREVNLNRVITDPTCRDNVALMDLDTVIVRKGLRARRWPATLDLGGEVNKPGVYTIDTERDSLADIIAMAGGLTQHAYPRGTVLIRKRQEILDPAQEKLTRDIFDLLQEISNKYALAEENRTHSGTRSVNGSAYNTAYSILPIFAKGAAPGGIREIDRILTSTRIPISLTKILGKASVDPGVRDGDTLYIPQEPQVILVAGAVVMPSPILFEEGRSLDDYIRLAGGLTEDAAPDKVFVIGVDGAITKKDQLQKLEKGDVIVAPPQPIVAEADLFETFISLAQVALNGLFLARIVTP